MLVTGASSSGLNLIIRGFCEFRSGAKTLTRKPIGREEVFSRVDRAVFR